MVVDQEGQNASQQPNVHDSLSQEHKDEEQVPSRPYERVVATHEIHFDTCVLALAVAPLPSHRSPHDSVPTVFTNRAVITVACSDQTTRILSFPLDPKLPSTTTKLASKKSKDDIQCRVVTEPTLHSGNIRGVALSYTYIPARRRGWNSDDENSEDAEDLAESPRAGDMWQLLVASHAAEPTPTLAITRVQLLDGRSDRSIDDADISTDAIFPESGGVAMAFNSSPYPSKRHSQLLFAGQDGLVRLYDTLSLKRKYLGRPTFVNPDVPPEFRTKLVATFFAPFQRSSDPILQAFGLRHRILDAQWVLGGKSIIILIDDGRWGVWDFAQAGPRPLKSQNHVVASAGPLSVPDTGITAFSVQGILAVGRQEGFSASSNATQSRKGLRVPGSQNLAPMTPHTRKDKQHHLFSPPSGGLSSRCLVKGKVSVAACLSDTAMRDETVVMWYGEDFFVIPRYVQSSSYYIYTYLSPLHLQKKKNSNQLYSSLVEIWKRAGIDAYKADVKTSGIGTLHAPPIAQLNGLSMLGEQVTSISQTSASSATLTRGSPHDIVISAEHRIVMWCSEKSERKPAEQLKSLFSRPPGHTQHGQAIQRADEDRLSRMELDLGGIDRLMGGMGPERKKHAPLSSGSPTERHQQSRKGTRFSIHS